jgi:hypothetical protein
MPVEILQDFTGCPPLEKGLENKGDAILDFTWVWQGGLGSPAISMIQD